MSDAKRQEEQKLTAIHKQILAKTLTQAHPLYTHVAQNALDGLRLFEHRAGIQHLLASSGDFWNAFNLVHEIAKDALSVANRFE